MAWVIGVIVAVGACGDNRHVGLGGEPMSLLVGQTEQVALGEDGGARPLDALTWTSDDDTIAKVRWTNDALYVTGTGVGITTISTSYYGTETEIPVSVDFDMSERSPVGGVGSDSGSPSSHGRLERIAVDPPSDQVPDGIDVAYTAVGQYEDGYTGDITPLVTWTSSSPTDASMAGDDADTHAVGKTTIAAWYDSLEGTTTLVITPAVVTSLQVNPQAPSLPVGQTQQMQAIAVYDDGSTIDVTAQAAWQSSATGVASIDASGDLDGLAPGASTIEADFGSFSATTIATVTGATITGLEVTPDPVQLAAGTTVQLHATETFSDNSARDVTQTCTWSSDTPTTASVLGGLVVGLIAGDANVTATCDSLQVVVPVTVTSAVLASITVSGTSTLVKGGQSQLVATGHYGDGTTQDITTSVLWTSDSPLVVDVSNALGSQGLAYGLAAGMANVTATKGVLSGSLAMIVSAATLVSIRVTPSSLTIPAGFDGQLFAIATYSDSTTADVTAQALWTTSAQATATVSNGPLLWGTVHGVAAGTATITATFGGAQSTADVTVTAAVLQQLQLSPISLNISAGLALPVVAVGVYSDGSQLTVTANATWSSDAGAVATVSNAAGLIGMVSAHVQGTAHISATIGSITASVTVTVGPPVLQSIGIGGLSVSLGIGQISLLVATGHYSDASTSDLSDLVSWQSSAPSVASVSAAGLLVALGTGSATITATIGSVIGSATTGISAAGCHAVINELSTGTLLSSTNEFVELYNPCTYAVDLSQDALVYRSALGLVDVQLAQLSGQLAAGAYQVFGGSGYTGSVAGTFATDLSALGGGVGLRNTSTQALVDSLGYGTSLDGLVEGLVSAAPLVGGSIARIPNGTDTGNNAADFVRATPTPGSAN
ncbi:MAG TPA: Ig-like domain-containing protein [Kofleriaceae bacterium]